VKDNNDEVMAILGRAKKLAQRYHTLTGQPLGITGEVAEFEAARLLNLRLSDARQVGCENAAPCDWHARSQPDWVHADGRGLDDHRRRYRAGVPEIVSQRAVSAPPLSHDFTFASISPFT